MFKALSIASLCTMAILASSCNSTPAPNTAAEEATLRSLDAQWSATATKKDVDGTVAFYADDAVVLPPDAPLLTDKKSIRDSWTAMLSPGTTISWKVTRAEVANSGELGYAWGAYQFTTPDPKGGPAISAPGKFSEIWKKQPDGKWKCIVDTYNSDAPAK